MKIGAEPSSETTVNYRSIVDGATYRNAVISPPFYVLLIPEAVVAQSV
jgi:hypothetical protein